MKQHTQVQAVLLSLLLLLPLGAYAGKGFYAGGSIGSAALNEDFDGLTIDSNSTAFRLFGGWRFNEYFALEGGYQDFGDFEQSTNIEGAPVTVNLSADGFTLGVAGSLPVGERFSVMGRFGMFYWDGNAEINNVSQATPEDNNPYFGIGLGYAVTDRFLLTGDITRFELDGANGNVIALGFQFRFNAK